MAHLQALPWPVDFCRRSPLAGFAVALVNLLEFRVDDARFALRSGRSTRLRSGRIERFTESLRDLCKTLAGLPDALHIVGLHCVFQARNCLLDLVLEIG